MTPTGIVRAFLIACMIHARSARSDDWDGEDPGGWELACDPRVDGACTTPCNPENYDCPGEVSELKHHTLIRGWHCDNGKRLGPFRHGHAIPFAMKTRPEMII